MYRLTLALGSWTHVEATESRKYNRRKAVAQYGERTSILATFRIRKLDSIRMSLSCKLLE